jgi:hypothetical protein
VQPRQLIEQLVVGLRGFLHRVTVQANIGRSARTNPSYERIDPYLERDLTIVEKRDLSVQSKVKAGSLGEQSAGTSGSSREKAWQTSR